MSSLRPEALTWTGLLAQWINFAQVAVALPDDEDGPQWRLSVPAVINLQAVTFALADLDKLSDDEQALALDKAQLLIEDSRARIDKAWADSRLPRMLEEIESDARVAWQIASEARRLEKEAE
jgi:hypothetical protein